MGQSTSRWLTAEAWGCPSRLPLPRASYAAGLVNANLVLAGGSYWKNGEKKIRTQVVHVYDLATQNWSEGCPLPEPLAESASCSDGERLYVAGGRHKNGITGACLEYRDNYWGSLPDLPEAQTMGALATANKGLYLLGGLTITDDWASATTKFQVLQDNHWSSLPPLPSVGIVTHSLASWNETIFCFGGAHMNNGAVENISQIHSFSISENRWSTIGDLPTPLRALSAATGPDSIYLFGGYGTTFENSIFTFNPQTGEIAAIGELPMGIADCKFFYSAPWWIGAGGEPGPRLRSQYTWQAKHTL